MGENRSEERGQRQHGRCVILTAPCGQLPRPLLRGLEQRGAMVIVASDAAAAIVDIAQSQASTLIIQDPAAQPALADLLAAVRRHFPTLACWQYQRQGNGRPELSRLELPKVMPPSMATAPPIASAASDGAHQPPVLGRVGPQPAPTNGRHAVSRRLEPVLVRVPQEPDLKNEPLISEEELAMLLGPTPAPAARASS